MYQLEEEAEADWWEVEALYDLCFAPGRTALSSYRLRDGVPTVAALCLILRDDDGTLAAAIRYWPAEVGGEDVLLLGPVAVHPTRQGAVSYTHLDVYKRQGFPPPKPPPDRCNPAISARRYWRGRARRRGCGHGPARAAAERPSQPRPAAPPEPHLSLIHI